MRSFISPEQTRDASELRGIVATLKQLGEDPTVAAPLRRPPGVDLPEIPPTRFTAADVPRLRDRLLEHWESGGLRMLFDGHPGEIRTPWHWRGGLVLRPWTRQEYEAKLRVWLREAELFFVTSDMTTLGRQAAAAMPNYEVNEDTMPARVGFVVWADSMCDIEALPGKNDLRPGERCVLQAALWAETTMPEGPGIHLVTLQLADVMLGTRCEDAEERQAIQSFLGPLCYHEEYPLPYGNRPFGVTEAQPVHNEAVGAVMSTWLMMSQRITDVTRAPLPRYVRRQYTREGRPEPEVRQVTLRRAASPSQKREPGQEASRVYTKQWVVRGYGYWRNTWYPSKQEHRQQFVHVPDYVKGPEGAPLVGGERVNVLRR